MDKMIYKKFTEYNNSSFTDMLECIPSKTLCTHFEYEYERRGFSPSPEEMMCIAFNSACYLERKYEFVKKLVPVIFDRQAALHIQKIMEDLLDFDDERFVLVPESVEGACESDLFIEDEDICNDEDEFFIGDDEEWYNDDALDESDVFLDIANCNIEKMDSFTDNHHLPFNGLDDSALEAVLSEPGPCNFDIMRKSIADGIQYHRRAVLLQRGMFSDHAAVALVNFDNSGEKKTFMPY